MVHASVARLNRYAGDPAFDRVMNTIESIQHEGTETDIEIDVMDLDQDMRFDLMMAMQCMGYDAYSDTEGIFHMRYDD